jgi:putative ABC transport system ATP-binding protein
MVVTHDPRMLRFATRAIYLLDGKVVTREAYEAASKVPEEEAPGEPAAPRPDPVSIPEDKEKSL